MTFVFDLQKKKNGKAIPNLNQNADANNKVCNNPQLKSS